MPDQDRSDGLPRRVGRRAFQAKMKHYLAQARQGRSIAVTSHGIVIAEIHPPSQPAPPPRRPGALKGKIRGKIRMAEDAAGLAAARQDDAE